MLEDRCSINSGFDLPIPAIVALRTWYKSRGIKITELETEMGRIKKEMRKVQKEEKHGDCVS